MRKEVLSCDIADREHSGVVKTFLTEVVFDHDQEDGRSKTRAYVDEMRIELCESCRNFMLENRKMIYAYGAMGHNKYTI